MADIYQIPESGSSPQFTIPLGGNMGGFGFGNGMNGIADLFGLAIIASMFGWGNGGWGNGFGGGNNGGAAFLSNQLANDSGHRREHLPRYLALKIGGHCGMPDVS